METPLVNSWQWLAWLVLLPAFMTIITVVYRLKSTVQKSKSMSKPQDGTQPDVVIVGSGVLGSALATVLARDGRRVTVIEKDLKEPDRIIGELLQPGGCRALYQLGLHECTEDLDAHTIKGYVVHDVCKGSHVEIPYPEEYDGVKGGRAFHHGRFVMALRKAAQAEPNVQYIEGSVCRLVEDSDGTIVGVQYREEDSSQLKEVRAAMTVVADGCFSKLRKGLVKTSPQVKSHFIALLMRDCPQMKPNHAELVLAEPSPVLVYQISSECTRVLVDVRGGLPKDVRAHLTDNVAPQMPEHLRDSFLEAVSGGQIRTMPNNCLPPSPISRRGVLCLGDALSMRHPLTGGGMTVVFNDIVILRQLLREISDLRDYGAISRAAESFYLKRKAQHSFVVDVLSVALYELFAAEDEHMHSLKDACFKYFELGGQCVAGPVALLSVLNPKPSLLLSHFFAVVVYAMFFTVRSQPLSSLHRSAYRATRIYLSACSILFPLVWSQVKTIVRF